MVVGGGKNVSKLIKIVGTIPAGMPPFTANKWLPIEDAPSLLRLAGLVMVVDLLESTSIARCVATLSLSLGGLPVALLVLWRRGPVEPVGRVANSS